jgi:hypothetical protein
MDRLAGLLGGLGGYNGIPPTATMTEAELAALKFAQMKAQMDEMSRARQMGDVYTQGTPADVEFLRGYNPQANTMQNIPPYAGGMSMRNAMPMQNQMPQGMDLNAIIRMLTR